MSTQMSATDLQKKIKGYLEELARETDIARKSDAVQRYLDFCARFHQYSPSNIFLILLSKPEATQVAGYEAWKKMGRFVLKGQRGIPILAPLIYKEDPDDEDSHKVLTGFKVVYVFDVSQTDGESLPPVPDWKSAEKNAELNERLIKFAESKGIIVTFMNLPGEIQGVSKGGAIEIDPTAGTKTLIHEITHELMHRSGNVPEEQCLRELEAESVSFIVSKFCNLGNLHCSNYLALYQIGSVQIMNHVERIHLAAVEIINALNDPINVKNV